MWCKVGFVLLLLCFSSSGHVVGYPSPTTLPYQPPEVTPPMTFPSYGHYENLQGPIASPSVPATRPALVKPTVPYPAMPGNRLKLRAPVPVAPQNQGIDQPPPTNLPSEQQEAPAPMIFPSHGHHQNVQVVGYPSPMNLPSQPQEVPPPMIFPSYGHHENLQGPVASPSVSSTRPSLEKPTAPYPALPRSRLKIRALVPVAPQNQDIGYPPPTNLPSEPWEAPPPVVFPSYGHYQNLQGPVTSPSNPATRPDQEKPTIPYPTWPMNRSRSKRQAPVPLAPRNQGIDYPPPTNLPSEPQEAPAPMILPSHGHHQSVQGPVVSPSFSTSLPAGSNPSIPYPALPSNSSKKQAPVPLAPQNVVGYPSPTNLSSQPQELPPPMMFPWYGHHENLQGPIASPSVPATRPALEKPTVPYPELPRNKLKTQAPVPVAPQNQDIDYPPTTNLPSAPSEALPPMIYPSDGHYENLQGPVTSPSIPATRPAQEKPTIPYPALPMNRSRSKRQTPVSLAPRNQGIGYFPPTNLPSQPQEAPPPMIFPYHSHHQNVGGPVSASPIAFPAGPTLEKPTVPYPALPRNRLKIRAPVPEAPQNQDIGYPPPTYLPSEPWEAPPPMIFPSHGHDQNLQGPVTSPSIPYTRPAQEKPTIPYPALPMNRSRSKRQAPVSLAPSNQGIGYFPPTNHPSHPQEAPPPVIFEYHRYHQNVRGPVSASPSAFPASPAQEKPAIPRMEFPRNRSKRRAPVSLAPISQGIGYPSPTSLPSQSRGTPPPTVFPSHGHHQIVQGPVASPSISSSNPVEKKPSIPQPALPRNTSDSQEPIPMVPTNQGYVTSPSANIYGSPQKKPTALLAPSPITRSHWHSPTVIAPTGQGPMPTPLASQPTQTMQRISPVAPQSKRPRSHTPVALTPIRQGNVPSQFSVPSEPPKVNSEIPAFAPSTILPLPHQYLGVKGPVSPPPSMIPSQAPQKKPRIPIEAPPFASPSIVEGPLYSPVNSPRPSSSGNSRIPSVSPPSRFPYHHRLRKHAPIARQPTIQGPVYSLNPSSSGNLGTPTVSPPIIYPSPPHHHSWSKHVPIAVSPIRNLRVPAASPSNKFPLSSHHGHTEGPVAAPINPSEAPENAPVISVAPPPIIFPPSPPRLGNLKVPAASPSNKFPLPAHHGHTERPVAAPSNPPEAPENAPVISVAPPPLIFPPPPPRQDCSLMTCTEPYTSTPPGSPCGCVYPMQVELGLGVALYEFFPLVSELAKEIAAGTFLKQSQVRIMGADADSQDQEKTIVNMDLVPLGENFDNTTAFLIFERFWQKKVMINETLFGDYWVIYVQYHGLPPSPPSPFSNATQNGMPGISGSSPSKVDPLGVDIGKRSDKMGAAIIAVVALSSAIAMLIFLGTVWIILLKCRNLNRPTSAVPEPTHVSSITKRSAGGASVLSGSMESSTSMSVASSMATYTGSAKTFTSAELEKATDRFNPQNIVGEGGFGRVYQGVLEDGTKVAVKVLTRDDQQGGREFIAEVEMLSRLHHRNLVKLIGICAEEHNRCLLYELIANGSVESHLHGPDKETAPLDWDARVKIALGAARGLAYLHEDSSPRVIHRDFKASNILLEDDFTPKVSDFGLAKSASEEVSGHISTRVMGTFGYVAPEYAMTGHLKVKSDVYSYGVVLLELLSGRKPVDMSQPSGQENLVTWARPLLTSKEGLETLVDPALGRNLPFDNVAKVAAIASMCVQPEHSHRPFMGEVVQALKLVYNDSDASNGGGSGSFSRGESSVHDTELKDSSGQPWPQGMQYVPENTSFVTIDYDSGPLETEGLEVERPLSASALMSTSERCIRQLSGSFRRHSSSGPLGTSKSKHKDPCYGIGGLAGGSISEHGVNRHFGRYLDGNVHELWP